MPLSKTQYAHRVTGLVYLLYVLGVLFGITALIGVIVNHTHLHKTRETYLYSHFIWQILSFWILFAGVVISILLLPGYIGMAFTYASLLWWFCTALFGSWLLAKKQPIPFLKYFKERNA